MKKLLFVMIMLFSLNSAYSACVVTGGACSIESLSKNDKKKIDKNVIEKKEQKKDKNNLYVKTKKKEYDKK